MMDLLSRLPILSENRVRRFTCQLLSIDPLSVTFPKSQGQMHSITQLNFDGQELSQVLSQRQIALQQSESENSLILRVAAKGLQSHKLENEAAVYLWLAQNTSIPIPQIVHYDTSADNALGHGYMLMTRVLDDNSAILYKNMGATTMDYVLDQLTNHFMQSSHYRVISSNTLEASELALKGVSIEPSLVIDEVQWSEPDIATHFPPVTSSSNV